MSTNSKDTSGRVIINFPPEAKKKLKSKAKDCGLKLSQFIKMKMLELLKEA